MAAQRGHKAHVCSIISGKRSLISRPVDASSMLPRNLPRFPLITRHDDECPSQYYIRSWKRLIILSPIRLLFEYVCVREKKLSSRSIEWNRSSRGFFMGLRVRQNMNRTCFILEREFWFDKYMSRLSVRINEYHFLIKLCHSWSLLIYLVEYNRVEIGLSKIIDKTK